MPFSSPKAFTEKIGTALRLDRAVRMVWQAGPKAMAASAGLVILQGFLPLVQLYVLKGIVDAVTAGVGEAGGAADVGSVAGWIGAAAAVSLFQTALQQIAACVSEAQALRVGDHIEARLHARSIAVDLGFYENPAHLDTLHRAQQEAPHRPLRIVTGLFRLVENGVALAVVTGLLFAFKWFAALLLFAAVVPGVAARWLGSGYAYERHQRQTRTERKAWFYHFMLTGAHHAREIRMLDLGGLFIRRFKRLRRGLRRQKLAVVRTRALVDGAVQGGAALVVFAMLAWVASETMEGAITLGAMVMYFQAFQKGLACQKALVEALADLYEDNLFLTHFFAFLDTPSEVKPPEAPVRLSGSGPAEIAFHGVTFGYPGQDRPVLEDITFTVKPGEVVALVGPNGSGKSTLIKLICRFYDPEKGGVTLDGVDLRSLDIRDLRRQVAVMFQDAVEYPLSVRDNVWFGDVSRPPSEAALQRAAGWADADGLIRHLPRGWDTVLGNRFEKGTEISIGEWQKIALARAFMTPSRVLVLDEPASALDAAAECAVFSRFKSALAGRTAIIVSHRFSTLAMADRMVVMSGGRIVETGSHETLMGRNGLYAKLYAARLGPPPSRSDPHD